MNDNPRRRRNFIYRVEDCFAGPNRVAPVWHNRKHPKMTADFVARNAIRYTRTL